MKIPFKPGVLGVMGAPRAATGCGGHLILGYQKSVSAAAGYHAMYQTADHLNPKVRRQMEDV